MLELLFAISLDPLEKRCQCQLLFLSQYSLMLHQVLSHRKGVLVSFLLLKPICSNPASLGSLVVLDREIDLLLLSEIHDLSGQVAGLI